MLVSAENATKRVKQIQKALTIVHLIRALEMDEVMLF